MEDKIYLCNNFKAYPNPQFNTFLKSSFFKFLFYFFLSIFVINWLANLIFEKIYL